ncbi:MAG: ECF transporter S component [Eubacterium sp.]
MKQNTKKIAGIGIFTAIVFAFQFWLSAIKVGTFTLSFVLVPIVVGAALYGKWSGAWLGLAFGVAVLLSGDAGLFLAVNPVGTVVTVLLKGALAGLCAGLVYDLLKKKNQIAAVITSAAVCPIVNTGIFLIGCQVFFLDTIKGWAQGAGFGDSVGTYMIVGLVGVNFIFEFVINLVLSPVILKLIKLGSREMK